MYERGLGGRRDLAAAAAWFRRAAEHGHKGAAADLAVLYRDGDGVPANKVLAYVWWRVAAELGDGSGAAHADAVAAAMTPSEVAEGERLVIEWRRRSR